MLDTIEKTLHVNPEIKKKTGKFGLAFYLTKGRDFFDVRIYGLAFSVVVLKNTDNVDLRQLKHQIKQYEEAFAGQVAFCVPDMQRNKRDAFLKTGIPFIAPPGQIYLPFLGIALQDRYPKEKTVAKDKMTPLEQQLFLWLLYHNGEITKAGLADELKVTRAAITKVTEQLNAKLLIIEKKIGKSVYVSLPGEPAECYRNAYQWMVSPVKRIAYANKESCMGFLLAGEKALSELSNLSEPQMEVRACYDKDDRINGIELIEDDRWMENDQLVKLEIWKYDPVLLCDGETVDILSLGLSLAEMIDERVEGEMQRVLEEKGWL